MTPAERIFELLSASGLDQKGLAERLEISPDVVSLWNRGKSTSYRRYIESIASILNTSSDYLLNGTKKEPGTAYSAGQAKKLECALRDIGIDVDHLSEVEIGKIAKLAKTLFED